MVNGEEVKYLSRTQKVSAGGYSVISLMGLSKKYKSGVTSDDEIKKIEVKLDILSDKKNKKESPELIMEY